MTSFAETTAFHKWLADLSAIQSTPTAENLYANNTYGTIRLANLKEYFRRMALLSPNMIIIGEAPGYQGTRRTGVPFGSEFIISGGMPEVKFFNDTTGFHKAYTDERVYKEPTSTMMWRTISKYDTLPLLWAVYPLHPHKLGDTESNRTPTHREVAALKNHLVELLQISRVNTVLALGNVAKSTLDELGIPAQKLRHPSHGGGTIFAQQLDRLMN